MKIRSIDELVLYLDSHPVPEYEYFWGHSQKGSEADRSCLSQWFPALFVVDGLRYQTAEHYMMVQKAVLFGDHQAAERALDADSPRRAKAIGRSVRGFDAETWDANRWRIVLEGNIAKFSQNQSLQDFLLSTGDRVLVEASPVDSIWGIGLEKSEALLTSPDSWPGLNLLGFALMEVRDQLRAPELSG